MTEKATTEQSILKIEQQKTQEALEGLRMRGWDGRGEILVPGENLWKNVGDLPIEIRLLGMPNSSKSTLSKNLCRTLSETFLYFPPLVYSVDLVLRRAGLFLELFDTSSINPQTFFLLLYR